MSDKIFAPTTGRMKLGEKGMDITHLDWMSWSSWINNLSRFKYGVQLGTAAAGTFNLNCAYLGIPCIGYKGLDTQEELHPHCTVSEGNLDLAREIAKRLVTNQDFYEQCSRESKEKYKECFDEEVYIYNMKKVIEGVINDTN